MILHEGMITQPIILTDDYTLVLVQDNRGIMLHANHEAFISTNPNLGNHRGRGKKSYIEPYKIMHGFIELTLFFIFLSRIMFITLFSS